MKKNFSRRQLFGEGFGLLSAATLLPLSGLLQAEPSAPPKRLLTVFLKGGWDSLLATDPVLGAKLSSPAFEAAYASEPSLAITGKPQLWIGPGLQPLKAIFASVPTAFINGMFVEVSAHEIAYNYMLSARLSLSRSREYPSLAALLGDQGGKYPPHIVLGSSIPLGATRSSSPPLQASSIDAMSQLLRGPGRASWNNYKTEVLPNAHELLEGLDQLSYQRLTLAQQQGLEGWRQAQSGLAQLYKSDLGSQLKLTAAIKQKFAVGEAGDLEGQLAGAFLALASGISPYITVVPPGNFDTHSHHMSQHKALLLKTAQALAILVEQMRTTPDPADQSRSLLESTTVLITSEFVRTPKFNAAQGTDHWQSASAILLGAGVEDGVVLGATGTDGMPLGWVAGQSMTRTSGNALLPSQIGAALLHYFKQPTLAQAISDQPLIGLFKGV